METLQNPTETKAIKEHRCSFCGVKIVIGEKYMKSVHIYDNIYTWKAHKYCHDLSHDLNMYDDCDEGVTQDDFVESVREYHHDLMIKLLPKGNEGNTDILTQLRNVNFRDMMWYVIRHVNKQKALTPTQTGV